MTEQNRIINEEEDEKVEMNTIKRVFQNNTMRQELQQI